MYKYTFALLFAIIFVSCKKEKIEDHPELVGTWLSSTTQLRITESGDVSYDYYYSDGFTTIDRHVDGTAKIKDDWLIIGSFIGRKKMFIKQYPKEVQVDYGHVNTEIILDNEKLYKSPVHNINYEYMCSNGILDVDEEETDCGGECDACPTCDDQIMNGDETGIDCGGACEECIESPCADTLETNKGLFFYTTNVFTTYNDTVNYERVEFKEYFDYYTIEAKSNFTGRNLEIAFKQKPVANMVYNLKPDFEHVAWGSYNTASINFKNGSYTNIFRSEEGQIYVTVDGNKVTASYCNVELTKNGSTTSFDSYAKITWDL